mmetsp:Transcript_57890/g.125163  ORF Transcript_57890/g.125163 Transcript_57890/m.125163 type:complete len:246 (+) Transcript_57890:388-1125(+)
MRRRQAKEHGKGPALGIVGHLLLLAKGHAEQVDATGPDVLSGLFEDSRRVAWMSRLSNENHSVQTLGDSRLLHKHLARGSGTQRKRQLWGRPRKAPPILGEQLAAGRVPCCLGLLPLIACLTAVLRRPTRQGEGFHLEAPARRPERICQPLLHELLSELLRGHASPKANVVHQVMQALGAQLFDTPDESRVLCAVPKGSPRLAARIAHSQHGRQVEIEALHQCPHTLFSQQAAKDTKPSLRHSPL